MSNSPKNEELKLTLDDIDTGISVVESVSQPDQKDRMAVIAAEQAQLENELRKSQIKNVEADREMRQKYAERVLRYLEGYSIVVGIFCIAAGFELCGFKLPDLILTTLVGSTAVAAIGLVGFIAKGLFQPPPN